MGWVEAQIVVSGETVNGGINRRDDSVTIEVPYMDGVSVGDKVSTDSDTYTVKSTNDVGGRNEVLSMEVENDKPVSRRTGSKAKRNDSQDEDDG